MVSSGDSEANSMTFSQFYFNLLTLLAVPLTDYFVHYAMICHVYCILDMILHKIVVCYTGMNFL